MKEQLKRVVRPIIETGGPLAKGIDVIGMVYGVIAPHLLLAAWSVITWGLTDKIEKWAKSPARSKMA